VLSALSRLQWGGRKLGKDFAYNEADDVDDGKRKVEGKSAERSAEGESPRVIATA